MSEFNEQELNDEKDAPATEESASESTAESTAAEATTEQTADLPEGAKEMVDSIVERVAKPSGGRQQRDRKPAAPTVPADPVRGKIVLEASLHCETGLHIGAGKGSLDIGGADNPVVKDAHGHPLLPGSSLRGRLRSLLEHALGLTSPEELVYLSKRRGQEVRIHESDRADDMVSRLFGRGSQGMERVSGGSLDARSAAPGRLTVYDAPLDLDSITTQMREFLEDELTEVKSELAIDRITAQATPRTLERVPAGARFGIRLLIDVRDRADAALLLLVLQGLRLMEDNALGGGGARGNGRVRISDVKVGWRGTSYYLGSAEESLLAEAPTVSGIQAVANQPGFAQRFTE